MKNTYLYKIQYSELHFWDVKRYTNHLSLEFDNAVFLRDILFPFKKRVTKKELQKNGWAIISKINFQGELFLRDKDEIQSYKGSLNLVPENSIIYSKINVRHGCVYFHKKGQEPFAASSEYPTFTFDSEKVNGEFLKMVLRSEEFKKILNSKTSGISKARVKVDEFLDIKIPLPSLFEQNRIVEAYNKKINQAEELERKAKKLEEEIENFLFEKLGLKKITIKQFKKGVINFFSFSNTLDRWDIHKDSSASLSSLKQAKYPIKTLNEVFNFENRSWKKNEHDSDFFYYVELGAIDPLIGITGSKKIDVKKAPSRATQIIKEGDLIIGTTRPYLKKFAIVPKQFDNNIASSAFQVISPSKNYNLEFLLEFLKSDYGIKQFNLFMTGALYPAITSKDLKRIKIPIPPISIQNKIAKKIKEVKKEIQELKHNSQNLKSTALKEFETQIF